MPRPLLKKNVQQRIKDNKAIMKAAKTEVTLTMTDAMKGEPVDAVEARAALARVLKASKAVIEDTAKLSTAE